MELIIFLIAFAAVLVFAAYWYSEHKAYNEVRNKVLQRQAEAEQRLKEVWRE